MTVFRSDPIFFQVGLKTCQVPQVPSVEVTMGNIPKKMKTTRAKIAITQGNNIHSELARGFSSGFSTSLVTVGPTKV